MMGRPGMLRDHENIKMRLHIKLFLKHNRNIIQVSYFLQILRAEAEPKQTWENI